MWDSFFGVQTVPLMESRLYLRVFSEDLKQPSKGLQGLLSATWRDGSKVLACTEAWDIARATKCVSMSAASHCKMRLRGGRAAPFSNTHPSADACISAPSQCCFEIGPQVFIAGSLNTIFAYKSSCGRMCLKYCAAIAASTGTAGERP